MYKCKQLLQKLFRIVYSYSSIMLTICTLLLKKTPTLCSYFIRMYGKAFCLCSPDLSLTPGFWDGLGCLKGYVWKSFHCWVLHINILEMMTGLVATWACHCLYCEADSGKQVRQDIGRGVCQHAGTQVACFGSASFLGAVKLPHEQTW